MTNTPTARCWLRPDLDHARCPSSTECTATEASDPLAFNARTLLESVQHVAAMGVLHLDDENEGALRADVHELAAELAKLQALLAAW